ncbi:hypothetical protein GQ457_05G021550 [Hibiscus cannabinus]
MADPPNNQNVANNNEIDAARGGNAALAIPPVQAQNRSIRDHLLPDLRNLNLGIVTPEIQAAQFELKHVIFNMLNSCKATSKVIHIDDESMYEAWDRYKELFWKLLMHRFNEWTKVIMFYNRVNAPNRMMLDTSANGTVLDKSAEEAIEILDRLANNDYQFPSTRKGMSMKNATAYELEPTDSTTSYTNQHEIRMQSQEAALKSLETQVGKFSQMLSTRPQENAPTIPHALAGPDAKASTPKTTKSNNVSEDKEIHLSPPFPHRLRKQKQEYQFKKFLDILKQVHINLLLVVAIEQTSNYAKFLKDIVSKQNRLSDFETIAMKEGCVVMIHNRLPPKLKDSNKGQIEDILVRVDKFIFPADFTVLDCEADEHAPLILGQLFLATGRMLIDCKKGELTIRVTYQQVKLNIFKSLRHPDDPEECQAINVVAKFNFEIEECILEKLFVESNEKENENCEDEVVEHLLQKPENNKVKRRLPSLVHLAHMPFGGCHSDYAMLQQPFRDMVEDFLEIFMEDFLVFGDNFDTCLSNLEKVLARCTETDLVVNWEKCYG